MQTILKIEGMSCEHCVRHVKSALLELDGVTNAEIRLEEGAAAVEHTADLSPGDMIAAVTDAGYTARL